MFCHNCGSEMSDDALFCEKCGARVEEGTVQNAAVPNNAAQDNSLQYNYNAAMPGAGQQPVSGGKPINISPKLIIIGALVAVAALAAFIVVKNLKTRIDLEPYITVEYDGYDSMGTARVEFDVKAFSRAYGSKIKYTGSDGLKMFDKDYQPIDKLIDDCISGKLSDNSDLKNGDVIVYQWDCDDELAASDFKAKLVYSDLEFTVQGLEEIDIVDPFEGIEVTFTGISSEGRAEYKNNSTKSYLSNLYYQIEPSYNLSNGDEVTVTAIDGWGEEYYAENYGIAFSQFEKTYTVEGLNSYISTLSEITESASSAMVSQGNDVIRAEIASRWEDYEILENVQYIGAYLLTAKNMPDSYQKNMYYLIYRISGRDAYPTEGQDSSFSYYYAIRYDNLILTSDGDVVYDLSSYQKTSQSFRRENIVYNVDRGWTTTLSYIGYEDMLTVVNQCVTVNLDRYSYETNITE